MHRFKLQKMQFQQHFGVFSAKRHFEQTPIVMSFEIQPSFIIVYYMKVYQISFIKLKFLNLIVRLVHVPRQKGGGVDSQQFCTPRKDYFSFLLLFNGRNHTWEYLRIMKVKIIFQKEIFFEKVTKNDKIVGFLCYFYYFMVKSRFSNFQKLTKINVFSQLQDMSHVKALKSQKHV